MSVTNERRTAIGIGREDDPATFALRLYVQYLQGLFNFMPSGTFHWEPDNEVSEIVIRGQAPLDMKTVGKRPAITVVMGPYQFAGIGLDNMLKYNPYTGKKIRTDLMSGHLVVYCIANNDIVAMKLGHIVSHYTRANQRLLESPGGFYSIGRPSPSVNAPSPPGQLVMGDPQQLIMVQVNIPYQLQWTWSEELDNLSPHTRNLKQITDERRASGYNQPGAALVSNIKLAMSTRDVKVRKLSGSSNRIGNLNQKPEIVTVREGIEDFQISGLESFQDE